MDKIEFVGDPPSTVGQRSVEEARAFASDAGMIAFFPDDDEVFLDVDSSTYTVRHLVLGALDQAEEYTQSISPVSQLITTSKSGNKHVYLRMSRSMGEFERLIVQSVLGSDPVKEALTLLRLLQGGTGSVALFETPEQALLVEQWRKGRRKGRR